MAEDPKYSSLPWIAHGQRDVYETEDARPEAEQKEKVPELSSAVVAPLDVDVEANKNALKAKQLRTTADRVDFSDRISASVRTGYIAFDTDELVAGGTVDGLSEAEVEPAIARFQRLQCEIAQLVAEVEAARKEVSAAVPPPPEQGKSEPLTAAGKASCQASAVCAALSHAHLQKSVSENISQISTRAESLIGSSKKLEQQIAAYKAKGPPPTSGDPRASHVVMELYHSSERAKNLEAAKFAEVEQRIQRLEALLGPVAPPQRFSLDAAGPAGCRGLQEAARKLHNSAAQLSEGSFLDQMESRLGAVHAKLGQVTQKKDAVATADTQNKVAELYDIVKRWECVAPVVPLIVDRLESVKDLHEQALQFAQATTFIDENQKEVETALKTHKALINKVETSLEQNLAKATAASEAIGKRVAGLK